MLNSLKTFAWLAQQRVQLARAACSSTAATPYGDSSTRTTSAARHSLRVKPASRLTLKRRRELKHKLARQLLRVPLTVHDELLMNPDGVSPSTTPTPGPPAGRAISTNPSEMVQETGSERNVTICLPFIGGHLGSLYTTETP